MPLYSFTCKCGVRGESIRNFDERDQPTPCPECSKLMTRDFSCPRVVLFKAGWYPNLDVNAVRIDSMQQLRDESSKRGLRSAYSEDNTVWKTSTNRWV